MNCIHTEHQNLLNQDSKNEIVWSKENHFGAIYCGQSCPCCRARVELEYGEKEFGACQICLKHGKKNK